MYNQRTLPQVWNLLALSGDQQLAEKVISLATAGQPAEEIITGPTVQVLKRTQRNLYKLLAFYPHLKPVIQTKLITEVRKDTSEPHSLIISINQRRETRGRKPK